MKRIGIYFLILYLSACSSESLPSGDRAGGFRLFDDSKHSRVIEVLQERKIPYENNSRGLTVYMLVDQAEVLGIIRKVEYGDDLSSNIYETEIIQNEEIKQKYISEFDSNNIPYSIDVFDGVEQISWAQIHGPIVDHIRQKINIENARKYREQLVEEGKVPADLVF